MISGVASDNIGIIVGQSRVTRAAASDEKKLYKLGCADFRRDYSVRQKSAASLNLCGAVACLLAVSLISEKGLSAKGDLVGPGKNWPRRVKR